MSAPGVDERWVDAWCALTDDALESARRGDVAAVAAALDARARTLGELAGGGARLEPAVAHRLLERDAQIGEAIRELQGPVGRELSEVRSARERLRARSGAASEPRFASRRA